MVIRRSSPVSLLPSFLMYRKRRKPLQERFLETENTLQEYVSSCHSSLFYGYVSFPLTPTVWIRENICWSPMNRDIHRVKRNELFSYVRYVDEWGFVCQVCVQIRSVEEDRCKKTWRMVVDFFLSSSSSFLMRLYVLSFFFFVVFFLSRQLRRNLTSQWYR